MYIYIYIYIHIYIYILHTYIFFFIFFSLIGYYRILRIVPCATHRSLLVTYFIYSSVYMFIPND